MDMKIYWNVSNQIHLSSTVVVKKYDAMKQVTYLDFPL